MFSRGALQLRILPRLLQRCHRLPRYRYCRRSWKMIPPTLWTPQHPPLRLLIRSATILSTWVPYPPKSTVSTMQSVVSPLLRLHHPTLQCRLPCNQLLRLSMWWTLHQTRVMSLQLDFSLQCPPRKSLGFFTTTAHLSLLFGRVTPPMAPLPRRIGQRRSCIGSWDAVNSVTTNIFFKSVGMGNWSMVVNLPPLLVPMLPSRKLSAAVSSTKRNTNTSMPFIWTLRLGTALVLEGIITPSFSSTVPPNNWAFGLRSLSSLDIISALRNFRAAPRSLTRCFYCNCDLKLFGSAISEYLIDNHSKVVAAPTKRQSANGLVESHWKIMVHMARAYITEKQMPRTFWFYVVVHAARMMNTIPGKHSGRLVSPFLLVHGVGHDERTWIPIFSLAFFHHEKDGDELRSHHQAHTMDGIVVGRSPTSNALLFITQATRSTTSPTAIVLTRIISQVLFIRPSNMTVVCSSASSVMTSLNMKKSIPPAHKWNDSFPS